MGVSPAVVAPNKLKQKFKTTKPNDVWVTDITYIKTHEGWLYLAVVIDLYSRRVVGWSMQSRMEMKLVLDALLMAVWRRKDRSRTIIHSDQGSQFTSYEWQSFLKANNLEASSGVIDIPLSTRSADSSNSSKVAFLAERGSYSEGDC